MSDPYTISEHRVVRTDGAHVVATCADKATAARVCALLIVSERVHEPRPLQCPQCTGYESDVTDSRRTDGGVLRRRKCKACGANYKTLEHVVALTTPGEEL